MEEKQVEQVETPIFDRKNCIKIDIDIPDFGKVSDIIAKRSFVFKKFGIIIKRILVFKTFKGWHIYFEIMDDEEWKKMTKQDIIFLQAIIGSDFKREVFNWMRAKSGMGKEWNLLFIRKYNAKGELISEEKFAPELGGLVMEKLWANENKEKLRMEEIAKNK